MSDETGLKNSLDDVLADYLRRVDSGEAVDREGFAAAHPELRQELRSYFAMERLLRPPAEEAVHGNATRIGAQASTHSELRRDGVTLPPQGPVGVAPLDESLPERFGRYRIVRPLGKGGMGIVFLAEDTRMQRKVALKTSTFAGDTTGELLERFYREARAAGDLRHPNICPVYDVGEIDGRHFISMAYLEGQPLSERIRPDKPLSEIAALVIVRKLALALEEAHSHGVIHRDLKPGNVMIDQKNEPIITDFGLARRAAQDEQARLTTSGMLLGSPAYMSPEQIEGDPDRLTGATDQYSLGVILYEMLTGQLPFRGSVTQIIAAIATREPPRPSELRPGLDPRVESVCLRMMSKNPDARFPSMKEAAAHVGRLCADLSGKPGAASVAGDVSVVADDVRPARATKRVAGDPATIAAAARKCLARHDYEAAVEMLESIPEPTRTSEIRALLQKAQTLANEVSFLIAEIDRASRRNDPSEAARQAAALERIAPGHERARRVRGEPSRNKTHFPWNRTGIVAGGVGILALVVTLGILIFRSPNGTVQVDVPDDVAVEFQGNTITVTNEMQSIEVEPGVGQTFRVKYRDLPVVEAERVVTLKRREKRLITLRFLKGDRLEIDDGGEKQVAALPKDGKMLIAPFDADRARASQKAWADSLGVPAEFTNSLKMKFVLIPPGEFTMGSKPDEPARDDDERPHPVRLTRAFYLSAHEVTRSAYAAFVEQTQHESELARKGRRGHVYDPERKQFVNRWEATDWRKPGYPQDEHHPAVLVNWRDADAFCRWLGRREGRSCRLPTEAEWEFAHRAGSEKPFPLGDTPDGLERLANVADARFRDIMPNAMTIAGSDGFSFTSPVGSFAPNPFGVFDTTGNVWEWCQDWYGLYSDETDNPRGPATGTQRILRGGSFDNAPPNNLRSANRHSLSPETGECLTGFRVVLGVQRAEESAAANGRASGLVFEDLNGDGSWSRNEPGLRDVTVFCDRNENGLRDPDEPSTRSDADGNYVLEKLPHRDLTISAIPGKDWLLHPADASLFPRADFSENTAVTGFNLALFRRASMSGSVYEDSNGNSMRDAGEPPIAGATVYLDTNGNRQHELDEPWTVSDHSGQFKFEGLGPGPLPISTGFEVPPYGMCRHVWRVDLIPPGDRKRKGSNFFVIPLGSGQHRERVDWALQWEPPP